MSCNIPTCREGDASRRSWSLILRQGFRTLVFLHISFHSAAHRFQTEKGFAWNTSNCLPNGVHEKLWVEISDRSEIAIWIFCFFKILYSCLYYSSAYTGIQRYIDQNEVWSLLSPHAHAPLLKSPASFVSSPSYYTDPGPLLIVIIIAEIVAYFICLEAISLVFAAQSRWTLKICYNKLVPALEVLCLKTKMNETVAGAILSSFVTSIPILVISIFSLIDSQHIDFSLGSVIGYVLGHCSIQ